MYNPDLVKKLMAQKYTWVQIKQWFNLGVSENTLKNILNKNSQRSIK